jgi:glutamyl-tRNA synthetase
MGFLPEALVNYLGRMGWSMPDEREKFSLDDMLENFDIQRVSLGGPIFDMEKLKWLNGKWIREDLSAEDLMHRLKDWMINKEYLAEILPSFQQRMEVMSDFAPAAAFLLSGLLEVSEEDFSKASKLEVEDQAILAQLALWTLEQPFAWEKDTLFSRLKALADFKEMKIKDFLAPLFIAVCGSTSSISVMEAMVFLGPDLTRARLRHAVNILGGISKKKNKKLEKEFASFLKSMD